MLCSLSTFPVARSIMDEQNGNFDLAKISDMSNFFAPFQKPKDKSRVHDRCHAHCTEEQHKNGNLTSGNCGCSSKKGPNNAISGPGGLGSFLEIWDTVPEFYFDIHYIKRLEL